MRFSYKLPLRVRTKAYITVIQDAYLTGKCDVRHRDVTGGHGIFANAAIEPGELIGMWSGRLIDRDRLESLPENVRRHSVQVEEDIYLTSFGLNDPPDFVNHSCEPNAGLDGQIAIVALRRILPGEEVTIDYAMCDGSPYDEFECACGAATCRGKVTGEDWRDPALWQRYAGHFSPYLQRRIDALRLGQEPREGPQFAKTRPLD